MVWVGGSWEGLNCRYERDARGIWKSRKKEVGWTWPWEKQEQKGAGTGRGEGGRQRDKEKKEDIVIAEFKEMEQLE